MSMVCWRPARDRNWHHVWTRARSHTTTHLVYVATYVLPGLPTEQHTLCPSIGMWWLQLTPCAAMRIRWFVCHLSAVFPTFWPTLLARRVRCTTLAPHVVVGAIVQRRVAFVATEPIQMLPFTEAIVVVHRDFFSSISNFNLILMCWSRVQVTERALAQVSSGIEM